MKKSTSSLKKKGSTAAETTTTPSLAAAPAPAVTTRSQRLRDASVSVSVSVSVAASDSLAPSPSPAPSHSPTVSLSASSSARESERERQTGSVAMSSLFAPVPHNDKVDSSASLSRPRTEIASSSSQSLHVNVARDSPRCFARLEAIESDRRKRVVDSFKRAVLKLADERREQIRQSADYCRLCILDAFQGRLSNGLANNSKKSEWIYSIFCIQTSDWMYNTVVAASLLHTISVFFEPENACPNSVLFKCFQFAVMAIYAVDIGLKMGYEGIHEYFEHDWQQLYVANMLIGLLDLCFCSCTHYANPLRPVAGLLRARKGRKFFEVLKKMVPGVIHNLVPILFFAVVMMALCSLLFDFHIPDFHSTYFSFYNWWFLILTNDTFDRLLPESVFKSLAYLMFFFPAIYVGQRFLVSMIIGDTYNTYKSYVKKQLKKEKLKEMQGLTKAFTALDNSRKGQISDVVWKECMRSLNPELSEEAVALYYELISGGNDNISILQFLSLRNILSFRLTVDKSDKQVFWSTVRYFQHSVSLAYQWIRIPVHKEIASQAQVVVHFLDEKDVISKLNFIDIFALCFGFLELLPFHSFDVNVSVNVCELISSLYCLEYSFRVIAKGGLLCKVPEKVSFSTILFATGCIGSLCFRISQPTLMPLFGLVDFQVSKLLLFFRLLRCTRMVSLNEDLKNFNAALYDVLPALVETFSFSFILSYMFGTLGSLLFGEVIDEWRTPLLGVVKAQQLTFMVGFLTTMETAVEKLHPMAILYFLSFLILSLTVSNIALSIIIDLHGSVMDMKSNEREGQRRKIDMVFDKLITQARARRWLCHSRSGHLNFKYIRLSEFQSSDVRLFITDSEKESLKLADLELCQKYAKIDLVKFYNEQHRNHKDINWEVDFFKNLNDLGAHEEKEYKSGEVIFSVNCPAEKLYLLNQGTVRLIKGRFDGQRSMGPLSEARFFATNFLGGECLQPHGVYSLTCVAETNVVVCIFDQDIVAHQMESEMAGGLLKMVFKSSAAMDTAFLEAKKGSRRFSLSLGSPMNMNVRGSPRDAATVEKNE